MDPSKVFRDKDHSLKGSGMTPILLFILVQYGQVTITNDTQVAVALVGYRNISQKFLTGRPTFPFIS